MADFTLTIPDAQVERVTVALCAAGGWNGEGDTASFSRSVVIDWIQRTVANVEKSTAERAALAAVVVPENVVIA